MRFWIEKNLIHITITTVINSTTNVYITHSGMLTAFKYNFSMNKTFLILHCHISPIINGTRKSLFRITYDRIEIKD